MRDAYASDTVRRSGMNMKASMKEPSGNVSVRGSRVAAGLGFRAVPEAGHYGLEGCPSILDSSFTPRRN